MNKTDFDAFSEMLGDVVGMYPRGEVNTGQMAMFFRALSGYSLDAVRAGFDGHIKDPVRGRFQPLPADILAQIADRVADDGRPGAEEAWAGAMRSADESDTIVWTSEMSQAWAIAVPVLDCGDKIGARMAFKEAYTRLVEAARGVRRPVVWTASLGFDAEKRNQVLTQAHAAGLLTGPAPLALPAPAACDIPESVREQFAELRARLTARHNGPTEADINRVRTVELKALAAEKVATYQAASDRRAA